MLINLDDISNNQLDLLDKSEDGEFEILDVKFDKRNTKNLEKDINRVDIKYDESLKNLNEKENSLPKNVVLNNTFNLVETIGESIIDSAFKEFREITFVLVTIRKPGIRFDDKRTAQKYF